MDRSSASAIEVMAKPASVEAITDCGVPPSNAMLCPAHEKANHAHFPNRMNLYYWMPA
jgi:hypothetical protein